MLYNSRTRFCLWVSLACALPLRADTLLNSTVTQDQERPALVQLTNGSVVCAWEDESVASGRIMMRRFNADLTSLQAEQRVDLGSGTERRNPAIASLSDGGFVVAYSATGLDADNYGVGFRRYDSSGAALDPTERQANFLLAGPQFQPQVAALATGGFVVCWVGPGSAGQDIFYRRFSATGSALDAQEILVNGLGLDPVTAGDQGSPQIAPLQDGGFVIVYEDRVSDDVYGVRIQASGNAADVPGEPPGSKQFLLHTATAHDQSSPSVAGLANGGFVVAYNTETDGTAASRRVMARVFNATGLGGTEVVVGTHTNRWQGARVAALPNGDFTVVWQALTTDPGGTAMWAVFAQSFSPSGFPRAPASRINTFDTGNQDTPSIAALNDGSCIISWQSFGQDTSGYGVFAGGLAPILPVPGTLTMARIGSPTSVVVRFSGESQRMHRLESSTNLLTWSSLLVTNPPLGSFEYTEPTGSVPRFFRVRSF